MKNIIFDWSGVVRDTVTNQMWIVNRIFKQYGVGEISTEEFRENWTQPPALFYQKYLPQGYNEAERSLLFQKLQLDADCPPATSFPEVVKLMHACKERGYYLAVVSSDYPETLLPEVKSWGLEGVFDDIITDANDKLPPVEKLLKERQLDPAITFFVGDSNHEIDVSKKTGTKSVAVTWGFTSEQKLRARGPEYVAHTPKELEGIILAR